MTIIGIHLTKTSTEEIDLSYTCGYRGYFTGIPYKESSLFSTKEELLKSL